MEELGLLKGWEGREELHSGVAEGGEGSIALHATL